MLFDVESHDGRLTRLVGAAEGDDEATRRCRFKHFARDVDDTRSVGADVLPL